MNDIDRICDILFPGGASVDYRGAGAKLSAIAEVARDYLNRAKARFIVVTCRIPTNYNHDVSYVVEAASEADAIELVRHKLFDFGDMRNYTYKVKPYTAPPAGRVL